METAQSAIRNLGGHEVNGRHLRVDSTDSSTKANEARRKHCTACSFAAVLTLVSKDSCLKHVTSIPPRNCGHSIQEE